MRTRPCQLHRDDQNQAYWRGRGPVLPHCGIYKSRPEIQNSGKNCQFALRDGLWRTWESMVTVGIDPSFRTICLATWVCHGQVSFSKLGPTVGKAFDLAT